MKYAALVLVLALTGCDASSRSSASVSASGVKQAKVEVEVGANGLTVEQTNIGERLHNDNLPGAIKHLYIISPYSGQVLIYSTVKGKVTSSGKRLTPTSVFAGGVRKSDMTYEEYGLPVNIGGAQQLTSEVLQDDGTYGTSDPYLYWTDQRGVFHQQYLTGGQIIHVSDQPLAIKSVTINMEMTGAAPTDATQALAPVP